MIIKMLTIDVEPKRTYYPGDIREISDADGKAYIEAKAAIEVKNAPAGMNKLSPEAQKKAVAISEAEKLVAELNKAAEEAEAKIKSASGNEKRELIKEAKAARQAATDAEEKLEKLKK